MTTDGIGNIFQIHHQNGSALIVAIAVRRGHSAPFTVGRMKGAESISTEGCDKELQQSQT
jgi:hypothetical protein